MWSLGSSGSGGSGKTGGGGGGEAPSAPGRTRADTRGVPLAMQLRQGQLLTVTMKFRKGGEEDCLTEDPEAFLYFSPRLLYIALYSRRPGLISSWLAWLSTPAGGAATHLGLRPTHRPRRAPDSPGRSPVSTVCPRKPLNT